MTLSFRKPTRNSVTKTVFRPALTWSGIALFACVAWNLGLRTQVGPALVSSAFPVTLAVARLIYETRWRRWLHQALSVCIPACTVMLFCETLTIGRGSLAVEPIARICILLEKIAEFLCENAIVTVTGLTTLVCSFRTSGPVAERKSFVVTTVVILLSTLSVTAFCAFAYYAMLSILASEATSAPIAKDSYGSIGSLSTARHWTPKTGQVAVDCGWPGIGRIPANLQDKERAPRSFRATILGPTTSSQRGNVNRLQCDPFGAQSNSAMNPSAIPAVRSWSSPSMARLRLASIVRSATVFLAESFRWYRCGRGLLLPRWTD